MSVSMMHAAWQLDIDATDKLVLLALADRADDDGRCWPGIASLAKKCSLSDRSVQRAIQALAEAGHLSRFERPGLGCTYHIHPRHSVTPDTVSPVTMTTPTPDTVSPNTSEIHQSPSQSSTSKGARARRAVIGTHLPDDWQPGLLTGQAAAAVARWQPGELEREISKFRDHWAAAGGANARKRDWQAAWRKWISQHDEWRRPNADTSHRCANGQRPRPATGLTGRTSAAVELLAEFGRARATAD